MLYKPREHQVDASKFHRREGAYAQVPPMLGTMLWHGMGLGKSATSLWEVEQLIYRLKKGGVKAPKFMVICPKSAMLTWRSECYKFTPNLMGDMVIYPYSQLHHAITKLKYIDLRFLIFDECHYLKSPETERIKRLCAFLAETQRTSGQFRDGRIMLATGTPIPNNAAEIYTAWALCTSPDLRTASERIIDNSRFEKWRASYSNREDINWVIGKKRPKEKQKRGYSVKYTGVNNTQMLGQLLSPFVHFRRVEDCVDLPEKQEIEVDLNLPDDQLLKDADIERPEAYMALVERLARAKTPHMIEWIREFLASTDDQLIVFAMNRHPIQEVVEHFKRDARMITGAETGAIRAKNVQDFQTKQFRILGMTYACGAESLNLQNCSTSLYHGYPWNDAKRRQAMARTFRQGQQQKTKHYFLTSGENDRHILGLVRSKGETEKEVESMVLQNATNIRNKIFTLDELI